MSCCHIKRLNIYAIESHMEMREDREIVFEEMVSKILLNFLKATQPQIQGVKLQEET